MQNHDNNHTHSDTGSPSRCLPAVDGSRPPQLNTTVCGCHCGCGCGNSATPNDPNAAQRRHPSPATVNNDLAQNGELVTPNADQDRHQPVEAHGHDDSSETASIPDEQGLEPHQVQPPVREIGDLGLHSHHSIQRSIARHQAQICSCFDLTTGTSVCSVYPEPSTRAHSIASSGYLRRVMYSERLLEGVGAAFEDGEGVHLPPPTVAVGFEAMPETGHVHPYALTLDVDGDRFSDYDLR